MQGKNGTSKHEPSIGVERRHCRRCGRHERVTITVLVGGLEIWVFDCGRREEYQT